jgi:hypothetical protein
MRKAWFVGRVRRSAVSHDTATYAPVLTRRTSATAAFANRFNTLRLVTVSSMIEHVSTRTHRGDASERHSDLIRDRLRWPGEKLGPALAIAAA